MGRYAAPPLSLPQINLGFIPKGYLGTQTTLHHVQALIRSGAKDFYVRQKAIDILLAKAVPPKHYLEEINALFEWVQQNVRYTKDPFRVEVLHSARRLLELRAGDCDDMTILLGSLLEAIGHPVRLVITGPDPLRPKLFSHIYLEVFHQGQWIPLDATMPYPMGWEPRTSVKQIIPIQRNAEMMHQHPEFQGFVPMAVSSNSLTSLIETVRQGGLKPRDPRVKSLWNLLRQRQLLHRSRWLAQLLKFMWQQGLSAQPRPGRAQRIERLLQTWGLLPGSGQQTPTHATVTVPARAVTSPAPPSPQSVPIRPIQSVTVRPVPGVMVKPVAKVSPR